MVKRVEIAVVLIVGMMVSACSHPPAPRQETSTPTRPASTTVPAPTASATPGPAPSPTPSPTATPERPLTHTVQSGDTLLGLALIYQVPVAALQMANDLGESTTIYPGQVLTLPDPALWQGASPYWIVHTVRSGETLSTIAATYDVALETLLDVNGIADAHLIGAGVDLIVPVTAPAEARHPGGSSAGSENTGPLPTASADPPFIPLPHDPPPAQVSDWPAEVLRLINYARAAYGLHPLTWHPILAQVAQTQADECAATGVCEHVNAAGLHYRERMRLAGYTPLYGSECIGRRDTPYAIVYSWLNETPPNDAHRRTILGKYYLHAGVGMAASHSTYYYFVVDFGRPAP